MTRDLALFDIYSGLRALHYSNLGAIRAMRAVGISLADAVAASRAYADAYRPLPLDIDTRIV